MRPRTGPHSSPKSADSHLRSADIDLHARLSISPELLEAAELRSVTDADERANCGIRYRSDHLRGIWEPNIDPERGFVPGGRVRRLETPETPQ
jgi:hypothetical protein